MWNDYTLWLEVFQSCSPFRTRHLNTKPCLLLPLHISSVVRTIIIIIIVVHDFWHRTMPFTGLRHDCNVFSLNSGEFCGYSLRYGVHTVFDCWFLLWSCAPLRKNCHNSAILRWEDMQVIWICFLAPLAEGQWAYAMAVCPLCVCALTFASNDISETNELTLMKLYRNDPWMVLYQIY